MRKIVAGGLTWYADFPVEVGDRVELPPTANWGDEGSLHPKNWEAVVTSTESRYSGYLKPAIRNLSRNGQEELPLVPTSAPGARETDPDTSKRAASSTPIKRGTQRQLLLLAFYDRRLEGGLTDEQAADLADGVSAHSEYAKRCSDLRNDGFIASNGEERIGRAGVARMVSEITDAGFKLVRDEGWR